MTGVVEGLDFQVWLHLSPSAMVDVVSMHKVTRILKLATSAEGFASGEPYMFLQLSTHWRIPDLVYFRSCYEPAEEFACISPVSIGLLEWWM
jgi:hypothetical protein